MKTWLALLCAVPFAAAAQTYRSDEHSFRFQDGLARQPKPGK